MEQCEGPYPGLAGRRLLKIRFSRDDIRGSRAAQVFNRANGNERYPKSTAKSDEKRSILPSADEKKEGRRNLFDGRFHFHGRTRGTQPAHLACEVTELRSELRRLQTIPAAARADMNARQDNRAR